MRHVKLIAAMLMVATLAACALSTRRISEIRQFPGKYDDRSVSIEGEVTSSWSVPFVPLRFYQVDDGTGQMTVLAEGARVPTRGAHVRALLQDVFRHPPASVGDDPRANGDLEGFHQELIGRHIERPLRSRRVMLDVAAGAGFAAEGRPRRS